MNDETERHYNQRKIHSPTWNYFKRLSPGLAKCDLCKKKLSYKTSITNLKRHLLLKHKVNLGYKITKPFTKLDQQINVRKLINLVKQFPCLWDIHSGFFSNCDKRLKAWNTIASTLCPDMDSVIAVAKLSERFCALKDHYFANKAKIENDPSIRAPTYYKDLLFLDSSQDLISISSSSSLQDDMEQSHMDIFEINEIEIKGEPWEEFQNDSGTTREEDSLQALEVPAENGHKNIEKSPTMWTNRNNYSASPSKKEKNQPQYSLQLNNADRDVLFLLSLTEEMRRVPKEMKSDFKSELMLTISRLVQKFKLTNGNGGGG